MTTDPSPSSLYALYHSGAYLCLAIVALYLLLKLASTRVAWFEVPGRAHYVTGILGAAALVIVPISQGTTPNSTMLATVLPVLVALFLPGAPKKTDTASSQSGFVNFRLMAFLAVALTAIGCAWFSTESKTVAGDAVDCLKAEQSKAITAFAPLVDQLLVIATGGDGNVDTARLKDGVKGLGVDVGGCVLADAVARALKPAPADPSAPKASPLVANPASLRAAFETIRASQLQHRTFHTPNGDV